MARDIKQLKIPNDNNKYIIEEVIYSIGIHALPGTKFKINKNEESNFVIGPSGNFSMSFENNPITSIEYIVPENADSSPSTTVTYPIIIDVVYERVGEV